MQPRIHGLIGVLGGRGSCKTVLVQTIVHRGVQAGRRFVVADQVGNFNPRPLVTVLGDGDGEHAAQVAISLAPSTLVLDEAHRHLKKEPREKTALAEVVRVGRQASAGGKWKRAGPVAMIFATHRPQDIHTSVRGLIDRLYLMRFSASALRELQWIEDVAGADVAARVRAMPKPEPGVRPQFIVVDV